MTALASADLTTTADPRLWTADQFLDFYMTRPDEERWQLVDGLAMMMVPPTVAASEDRQATSCACSIARSHAHRPDLDVLYETGVAHPRRR